MITLRTPSELIPNFFSYFTRELGPTSSQKSPHHQNLIIFVQRDNCFDHELDEYCMCMLLLYCRCAISLGSVILTVIYIDKVPSIAGTRRPSGYPARCKPARVSTVQFPSADKVPRAGIQGHGDVGTDRPNECRLSIEFLTFIR